MQEHSTNISPDGMYQIKKILLIFYKQNYLIIFYKQNYLIIFNNIIK